MAYEKTATQDSKKTTKKIPDDPYFDSSSPAGSNFKKTTSSVKSNGFQNKQLDDPYFSNTSPAGSTMSSDKSTWRNTNSGWNVPPSGGTAAQGGGSTATRRSPSDDPYYDDRSPAGSTFESQRDRRSSGSTVRRDNGPTPGGFNQAPNVPDVRFTGGGMDAMPHDIGGTLSTVDPNKNVWRAQTMFGTPMDQEIQFSTPFTQQVGGMVERALAAPGSLVEKWGEDTGYGQMIEDRKQRARDDGWGAIGANLTGALATAEAIQKNLWSDYVPRADKAFFVTDDQGNEIIAGPNYSRNVDAPQWAVNIAETLFPNQMAAAAEREEPMPQAPETKLSWGQAVSSLLGAFNVTYNMANPNNEFVAQKEALGAASPSMAEVFQADLLQRQSQYAQNNAFYAGLPEDKKRLVAQAYNDLNIHGPDRQLEGMTNLLTWDQQIKQLTLAAEVAEAEGNALAAATMSDQATKMAAMSPTDIVEQQYNWGAELLYAVATPDPAFDWVRPFKVGSQMIWGTVAQKKMADALIDYGSRGARASDEAVTATANAYQEAFRLADEWVQQAAGEGSELYELWTGGKMNIARELTKITPESEITRIKYSFADSLGPVLAHAKTQPEAKLLVNEFLDGTVFVKNPDIGRSPFTDPVLIRDMGLIQKYKDDILNLESLNADTYNPSLVMGEMTDFLQRRLMVDFGLWPDGVPFGATKITAKPYVTKDGKATSKFVIEYASQDGTVVGTRKGLLDSKEEAAKLAKEAQDTVNKALPGVYTSFNQFVRSYLATTFLYAPSFVIGNAMAAAAAYTGDGLRGMKRSQKILDKYNKMYGGAGVTGELLDTMRAEGMLAGEAGELTKAGADSIRTSWGIVKDKLPKYLKWTVAMQDTVAKKMASRAFGTGIGAEEFWRLNYFNHAFDEMHNYGREEATAVFAAGLRALNVDPVLASALSDNFYRLSSDESPRTILTKLRELTGSEQIRAGLASLNIGPTSVSPAGQRRMAELLNSVDPADKEAVGAAIGTWLRQEIADIDDMLLGTELPPVPFRKVFTSMDATQEGADFMQGALRIAERAGMDKAEARGVVTETYKGVYEAYTGEFEQMRKWLGIDPSKDQLQLAVVFYEKAATEKRAIQSATDNLYHQLNKVNTKEEAQAIFDEVNKLWRDYSANVKVWGNDLRAGSFTPVGDGTFGVGEIVRLNDGTEVTIKQVLTENDVTSYVVTPRVQQAAQAAPQAAEVAPTATQATTPRVLTLTQDDMPEGFVFKKNAPATLPDGRTVRMRDTLDWDEGDTTLTGYLAEEMQVAQVTDDMIPQRFLDGAKKHKTMTLNDGRKVRVIGDLTDGEKRVGFIVEVLPTARPVQQAAQAAPAPTFVERTINASEIAPLPGGEMNQAAAQQVADLYGRILDDYMGIGDVEGDINRIWEAGSTPRRSNDEWQAIKDTARTYIQSAQDNMLLGYGTHPSAEFFDEMVDAELAINAAGDHVIAMLEKRRALALSEQITWTDYAKYRDEIWRQYTEYAYGRYQYATVAGMRHSLGTATDEAIAQLPLSAIEPPTITVDDVRRAQAIQEGKIAEGTRIPDRRIVASINKHLGTNVKKLDELDETQLREAWRYYRQTATDQGIPFEQQWFRYRTGDFAMFSGMTDDMDFIDTMWRMEGKSYATGNVEAPNFGTARAQRVRDAMQMAQQVYDNIEQVATTTVNSITPQARGEILKLINNAVSSLDDVRYAAAKAGQEAASYGMLNYWKRRNFDKALGYLYGFHYYATRAPLNWARRIAENPAIAYDLYQYNRAYKGENQQQIAAGAPSRIEGTLPNPLKPLLTNIGRMGETPLNTAAGMAGEWMPERFYEPSKYLVPYGWPNDFVDPSQGQNAVERNLLRALRAMPVMMPQIAIPMSAALDFLYPRDDSYGRLSDVQVGDYSRFLRMGAYALQATPKVDEGSWAAPLNAILGEKAPGFLGDQFDSGRIMRTIATGIAAGDYDQYAGELAMAQIENVQKGLDDIPEMSDPAVQKQIEKIANQAINDAGMERFANLFMGYMFRMPGQDFTAIEAELRAAANQRRDLGYSYENQMGSQAAVSEFTDTTTLSSGVPLGEALPSYWNYSQGYSPKVDKNYGEIQTQAVTRQARKELSAIYDRMGEAESQFVWENPYAAPDEIYNLREPFYAEVDALREKYPSADLGWFTDDEKAEFKEASSKLQKAQEAYTSAHPGSLFNEADYQRAIAKELETYNAVMSKYPGIGDPHPDANRSRYHNPNERALAEMDAVARYEPPGKPEWPGEGASPAAVDQYYTDYGEWAIKRLNVIDRVTEQWILGEDTPMSGEGGVNSETARYRATIGRHAQDLIDSETLRYKSGVYIEWYMRNQLAKEARQPFYAAEKEALVGEFGEDGFALWQKWKAIPEDPKLEFPNWTEAHQEFIRENPEVQAMKIFDASPEVYEQLLRRGGGPRIFEAIANYPPKGPERDRWYKTQPGSVIDATHWWFGVNDDLRSTRSRGWEEGQAIGENWLNYTGPRPVGSDRQPIGINPNDQGITYSYPFRPAQGSSEYGDYLPMVRYPQQTYNPVNSREEYLGRVNYGQPSTMPQVQGPPTREQAMAQGSWEKVLPDFSPDFEGVKGYTAPPASQAQELAQYQQAVQDGTLTEWIAKREAAIDAGERTTTARSSGGGGGGGYRGYWYRGRYYSRRRGYRRRGGGRRGGYRRYSRGSGGRRYGGYGGGGGGGSTVDEGQELFLNTNNPPRIYAREFASWLMPSSSSRDVWRPTGASTGMRQPQQPSIRPWRRINVRA